MKIKDYQWLVWVIVLAIAVLASSCTQYQAKVKRLNGSAVHIVDVDEHISVGDTIVCKTLNNSLVVVKEVYNK